MQSIAFGQLIDEAARRFELDPAGAGMQLFGARALLRRPFDPSVALLIVPDAIAQPRGEVDAEFDPPLLPGRHGHDPDPAALLRRLYPAAHRVHGLDGAADATIGELAAGDLEGAAHFVPALALRDNLASPYGLAWLVARLRAPGGCPWDREQDHRSLRPFLLEETYEVYDALEHGSTPQLAEELGDLLLQIVLHAEYGAEAGVFDFADVTAATMRKIIRRHPHVFGDVVAGSSAEVVRNWEQIKADERTALAFQPDTSSMPAAFGGLSRSLPALAYAQEMQGRAAALGYDWPSIDGIIDKVAEEAAEVAAATDPQARHEEFGDLLLVAVNLARRLGVDAEAALRAASTKFAARFAVVERLAAEREVELRGLSLEQLDELWREAKTAVQAS